MSMRIKAREKNLLLSSRSANKVEQIKTFKDGLRDTTKRKSYSKYQSDEREILDINSRKRSKTMRKSHSEKEMKIPIKESMTIKESAKVGSVSINYSNEDNYKNAHNVKRQTQNYSIKYTADKRSFHLNENYDKAIRSKESNQPSPGPDKKGDSANKVMFVPLNFADKPDKHDKTRKATNQTKLRRLWKNLQHTSGYHRKRKIGRLRKYCCWKTTSTIRKGRGKNESNRNDPENENISPRQNNTKETKRIHWKKARDEKTERIFESESNTTNNSKTEHNPNNETSNQIIDESDRDLLDFLYQKSPHGFNNLTPEDDVSKIDEKYLKYILLITNNKGVNTLKNNENQENINKSEDKDEETVPKDKRSVIVLKVKTSQNQLKRKQIPLNTIKDDNQSNHYLLQNKKDLIDHKIESESKPVGESLISDQRPHQRKKIIVLKLSSTKQSDCGRKSRINQIKKQSGPANTRENKNNSREPKPKNPTPKKKEIVTTPPREEESKFDFIEIWRRNSKKESQGSLSSKSSIDPPDNQERSDEDSSDCEYLGIRSYQALKKIVEQEVQKIFKSYKHKENERTKAEPNTIENTKLPVPLGKKSGTNTVNKAQLENKLQPAHKQITVVKDDCGDVKSDRVMQTKISLPPQREKILPQDQNFKKQDNESEKLRVITRKNSEELNRKLKILSEQENKVFKIPSEILKNWTIMHRLEKAFLALGTPNFHSKSLPVTKIRVVGGKVTNAQKEKVGVATTKTRTHGGSGGDENKTYRPHVNSSKIKIPQKKLDNKHLGRSETEQELKKSKTEKRTVKEIKKKDNNNVQNLHRKSIQAPSTNKSTKSCNTKKSEEASLSKDQKAKVKQRIKPETLSRVPQRIFENTDTKTKHRIEKPIETQEVTPIPVKPEPTCEDDSDDDDDDYSDCKTGFSIDPDESSVLGCTSVSNIENDFAEEVKHFDTQIEKLLDLKSSRNLSFERKNQNKIEDENLERKKTFDVFPAGETTDLKLKKSQSCHKLEINSKTDDVKCFCSTINQKTNIDYRDPFEQGKQKSTYEQYSGSNVSREDQNCSSKAQLFLKISNNPSFKHDDYVSDKTNTYIDEEVTLTQPNAEKMPVEDIPQKLPFSRKEVNLNERVVKERSILSLGQNLKKTQRESSFERINRIPSTEDYEKPNYKRTPDVFLQRIFHTKGSPTNYSNTSAISSITYDIAESSYDYPDNQTQKRIIIPSRLCPGPPTQNISKTKLCRTTVRLNQKLPSSLTKTVKIQPNWESDIRQYRTIVKDIIDQYKRTKGFLKQNQPLLDPLADTKFIEVQGETPPSSNLGFLDINEYRRKIISEYRDLSIFEYKSKIQEKSNSEQTKTERSLDVVREVTPEMDYDIKDFQPNIKKILNSQIYVDQNHFYKLKCLRVKPADQNHSLQEVTLGTSKLGTQQIKLNDQSKSARPPKSNVSLPNSKVYSVLFHTPNHSKVEVDSDFTFDDFMSLSEFEETESEFTDYH